MLCSNYNTVEEK